LELVGESFLGEQLGQARAEEDRVESEEGSDGGVDLVVLGEKGGSMVSEGWKDRGVEEIAQTSSTWEKREEGEVQI